MHGEGASLLERRWRGGSFCGHQAEVPRTHRRDQAVDAPEILQGKPIDRPTHPMLVHFPIAFYIGALGLDVLSRIGRFPAAPQRG